MVCVVLSDIHGNYSLIRKIGRDLKEADIVIVTGDITHFGGMSDAGAVLDFIEAFCRRIVGIAGNCDYEEVREELQERGYGIEHQIQRIDEFLIGGIGGSLPCPSPTPQERSEQQIADHLHELFQDQHDNQIILVTHQPPYGSVADRLSDATHVGSRAITHFIEEYKPRISLCGHIHESFGIGALGETLVVNPGSFSTGRYAKIEITGDGRINAELKSI